MHYVLEPFKIDTLCGAKGMEPWPLCRWAAVRGGRDDAVRLQFEAPQQFDDEERQTAHAVLEGIILKHQARQSQLRTSVALP